MTSHDNQIGGILHTLQERAKELNCLYKVDEVLSQLDLPPDLVLQELVNALPAGWQYPDICRARITIGERRFDSTDFHESEWSQHIDIILDDVQAGAIEVFYLAPAPRADEGPFLKEERELIRAIADRVAQHLLRRRVRSAHDRLADAIELVKSEKDSSWKVILDFLRRTDQPLLARITRKMINYLAWTGVDEATQLLRAYVTDGVPEGDGGVEENRPLPRGHLEDVTTLADKAFEIASRNCSDDEMISNIRAWIEEDKASALVNTLETTHSSLSDIAAALDRFRSSELNEDEMPRALQTSLRASLLRRFFSGDMNFLRVLKNTVRVEDFQQLIRRVVFSSRSHGSLGGKSSGLFTATTLLERATDHRDVFDRIKVPKTWHISSDSVLEFIRHNNLDDVYDYKYRDIERVRRDYPHIVQVFKNSQFPTEISNGLAVALDDFGQCPLIIRSSSLLEDQTGAAFSGKYKSLFVANHGTKKENLAALQDAVAEVYASVFAPDPIEYRAERGLLDVHEEMAVMIQEVVGVRVGKYFLPSFAGVAFSQNEFRWSPRIQREDGLVRLVPGLGTRAVDRLSDDYPVLFSPGKPGLRVNVTVDEVIRYSPQKIDVIDLEQNEFRTISVKGLLRELGDEYPLARKLVSIVSGDSMRAPTALEPDWESDEVVVTFAGLMNDSSFARDSKLLLDYLSTELGYPVDLEFASDGENLFLLQCRAQSASANFEPSPIPRNLPRERVLFTANRFVSNGRIPDITHIVYVDPEGYASLPGVEELKSVARAVGRLNKILPRRQFILMGPGRWGSRGDIKLGVGVTYGEINNTAALMEVAWTKGNYVPELSFGTHFFQDLVEADIRYLPLYPDEDDVLFNELFLRRANSILTEVLPEYAHLDDVIRVIDVPGTAEGQILKILLNAELEEAVGFFSSPTVATGEKIDVEFRVEERSEDHWRWRLLMAERVAASLDAERFGVKAMYVIGSAKNATSGPASDLDIVVHFGGTETQREQLTLWLDGWSRSLAEINYLRTGYRTDGLLDVHFVSDEQIENKSSFGAKIGAVTDAARPLELGTRSPAR